MIVGQQTFPVSALRKSNRAATLQFMNTRQSLIFPFLSAFILGRGLLLPRAGK
jgi:hypothetical protein